MYKGFLEDVAYVFDLISKELNGCAEDSEERKTKKSGDDEYCFACGQAPCFRDEADDDEEEEEEGFACCEMPCFRDSDDEDDEEDEDESDKKSSGGITGGGPLRDVLKCMFDSSDVDYDYED